MNIHINLFPYIWFPLFKLSLFNHREATIKRCSKKRRFWDSNCHKNHLESRKYLWEIPWKESVIKLRFKFLTCNFTKKANSFKWIFQGFCINCKNTFSKPALNGCFRQLETNKRTSVIAPIEALFCVCFSFSF